MEINIGNKLKGNVDSFLSREDSRVIKGIAIILMLTHHLWGFPDRVAGGTLKHLITFDGQPLILYLAYFAKICVSLYFFVGGYGMYISNKDRKFDPVKN